MTNHIPPISVLKAYELHDPSLEVSTIGNGLINHTWKLSNSNNAWILQKINTAVFQQPAWIQENIEQLGRYIQSVNPRYLFVMPLSASDGTTLVQEDGNFYRLFTYIPNSQTITVVENIQQAKEAAFQFGNFTRQFANFDCSRLYTTIKNFHNLSFRYEQFQQALSNGLQERILEAEKMDSFIGVLLFY